MKKIITAIIWIAILGVLSFATFRQLTKNKEKLAEEAQVTSQKNTSIPVLTGKVVMASFNRDFNLIGSFAPIRQAAIMSEMAGKIVSLDIANGSFVKEGSVVAAVDNELIRIQLETAKINLTKAENDLKKLMNLIGQGGVTQQQIDDANLGIANLNAGIKGYEKQISMTYVKAPISGAISNKMVEKGSLISPAFKMADITDISRVKLQVYLTEGQVINIRKGQKIRVEAVQYPGQAMQGNITFIDVNASQFRRYLVDIEVANPGQMLKAGMTGTAYFEGATSRELLSIPREAIVGSIQNAKVYVVENGKAILKSVETGQVFGNLIEVRNGLTLNDVIVISGQINIEDGMAVTVAIK